MTDALWPKHRDAARWLRIMYLDNYNAGYVVEHVAAYMADGLAPMSAKSLDLLLQYCKWHIAGVSVG